MNPRLRMCRGKERHKSMGKAEAHIRHLVRRGMVAEGEMRAYPCVVCCYYHIGHKSRQQRALEAS